MERAILGGGCFWCLEAVFERIRGVLAVTSGYCGGEARDASYEAVCSGRTAHAEVVAIDFDPLEIGFAEVLHIFFTLHDPTTPNRQGNDIGPQYRSVIFCQSEEQREIAAATIAKVGGEQWWAQKVVTEIAAAPPFYAAEEYHQRYFERNPNAGYCAFVVAPKVAKARSVFAARLKD